MDRIDALRYLIDVAEIGSFSGVARRRSVATSTVALAVGQLEQEFATRLMTRSTRRLVFTHQGQTLLADARRIVSDWDSALCGLREDGPLAGPIRVTATNDFGRHHLRPWLDAFQDLHPGVCAISPHCGGRCLTAAIHPEPKRPDVKRMTAFGERRRGPVRPGWVETRPARQEGPSRKPHLAAVEWLAMAMGLT